jgi:hypothetical protein
MSLLKSVSGLVNHEKNVFPSIKKEAQSKALRCKTDWAKIQANGFRRARAMSISNPPTAPMPTTLGSGTKLGVAVSVKLVGPVNEIENPKVSSPLGPGTDGTGTPAK